KSQGNGLSARRQARPQTARLAALPTPNSEEPLFLSALREGVGHGGALLYPAMPYPYYTKVTDRDGLAIRAYLNTVQPVRNAVVSNKLPFPFDVREEMKVWNGLYFKSGEFEPDSK